MAKQEEVQRVLKWIECQDHDDVFTRTSVINDLVSVSFSMVGRQNDERTN